MYPIKVNKTVTHTRLISFGFRKYGKTYRLSVPICMYKGNPTLSLDFIINIEEKSFQYEIIDNNTGNLYSSFYNQRYGRNYVVNTTQVKLNEYINKMIDCKILRKGGKKDGKNSESNIQRNESSSRI